MIFLVFLIGGIYVLVIASFFYGWEKLRHFDIANETPSLFVSIVIPMRDEEDNILNLLHDLSNQTFPAKDYEIILVNDHSVDHSYEIASGYSFDNLKIISLPDSVSGKKAALAAGIQRSKGELIITTDADCRMKSKWLISIALYYIKAKPVMILCPVVPSYNLHSQSGKILNEILTLEFYSLLGSTAGAAAIGRPVMCNGANLAFPKNVYQDIQQTLVNTKIASGDDIFGMLALKKKYPGRIHFLKLKDAAVYTTIAGNVKSFFKQRGRWAAKFRFYRDPEIIVTALAVFGINLMLLVTLVYSFLQHNYISFFGLLIIKSLIDFPFLYRVTSFFGKKKLMRWFPVVQSFYFFYVCITVFFALVMPNVWKGRKI